MTCFKRPASTRLQCNSNIVTNTSYFIDEKLTERINQPLTVSVIVNNRVILVQQCLGCLPGGAMIPGRRIELLFNVARTRFQDAVPRGRTS
jgi:hypothetical protein